MLNMKSKSCVYCGDTCEITVPLDWSITEPGQHDREAVRLNLCERCSHSWMAFADDFCPTAEREKATGSSRTHRQ
jgi:hypothetical protein